MAATETTGLQSVIDAGICLGGARAEHNGTAYAIIPQGAKLESLEALLPAPSRAKGSVTVHDAASFATYFNRFKTDASVVFADQQSATIVGVLNYHGPATESATMQPAWADWRVIYSMPKSLQWRRWREADGRAMAQADFVRFMEENRLDIRQPSGADILEIAKHLEAKRTVDFVSATRLSDGSRQFTYNETTQGVTSKGNLVVPEEFVLGLPVYQGETQAWPVTAFLRYRIDGGKLLMWFDLHQPDDIELQAFSEAVAWIGTDTGVKPFMGTIR
ncbi:DUF2303 family protein [Azospirillum sp.]|uniref:DUF2303 family protein n=1 Tax=Azospirillum sp. TaxID=34012 RepID=UPI002D291682|nr:DUF2303 family protein [Azospirillum sp.]HYF88998.1 DUF2303 family protein [Azospirillum sp.]